jgi:tight adherence protein B
MIITLIAITFFLAILLGIITIYMAYAAVKASPQYDLRRRLRTLAVRSDERLPADLKIEILREMSPIDKVLYRSSVIRWLDRLIQNTGLKVDVKVFILVIMTCAVTGFAIGFALRRGAFLAILFLIVGALAPLVYAQVNKNRRVDRFTEEFPNALDMISRSLKAGHSVSAAIQLVSDEMTEPLASLFKTAYEEQTLGLSIKDSLTQMMDRMQSIDLRLFVTAVLIHREVGGNLSETLERLAQTIRERIRIRRQIKVYTAQGRLTGYILAALPIAMAIFLYMTSPDYLGELVTVDVGKYAIAVIVAAQIIGFIIIKRLINIKI